MCGKSHHHHHHRLLLINTTQMYLRRNLHIFCVVSVLFNNESVNFSLHAGKISASLALASISSWNCPDTNQGKADRHKNYSDKGVALPSVRYRLTDHFYVNGAILPQHQHHQEHKSARFRNALRGAFRFESLIAFRRKLAACLKLANYSGMLVNFLFAKIPHQIGCHA